MNKKVYRLIDNSKIVSFDIFDTLVKRYVNNPIDIFEIIENKYNLISNDKISNFKEIRIKSEINLRNTSNKREITIKEIYDEIKKKYKMLDIDLLEELEKKVEVAICYPNQECIDLLNYCKKKNKTIIITSDMYLDKETILSILEKCNISFDKLFLSSELNAKKSDGTIFNYIIQKYMINENKIVHIGDNFKSDYLFPKIKRIKSFRYKSKQYCGKSRNTKLFILKQYLKERVTKIQFEDIYEKFGYENLGPLMYGFCKYLEENIPYDYDKVFLAREGNFIKKSYETYENTNNDFKYFYVSRKSISSSLLNKNYINKDIIELQSISQIETVEMFLKRFNLVNDKNKEYLLSNNIKLSDIYHKKNIKYFIINNFSELVKNSNLNSKLFEEYLEELDINNKSVFIDIGWNGTMQDLIQKKLNNNGINVQAYYLGVRSKRKNEFKHGYLFDGENSEIEVYSRSMVGLLEILFSANHGSTIGYKKEDKVIPILAENDVNYDIMQKIIRIQNGALRFIKDFKNEKFTELISFEKDELSYNLLNIGLRPTNKDIKIFKEFKVFDENVEYLVGENNIIYYMFHPLKFKNDYLNSSWKNAFLKNIFKINFPYFILFKILYKLKR